MISLAQTLLQRVQQQEGTAEQLPRVYGVHYASRDGKWVASKYFDGKTHTLGRFATRDEAVKARQDYDAAHPGQDKRRGPAANPRSKK